MDDSDDAPPSPTASAGRFMGEVRFQLEYKGKKGPMLAWLFLDSKLLISPGSRPRQERDPYRFGIPVDAGSGTAS